MAGVTIIGCSRSGTTYTALVLRCFGADVGHERLGRDGICSWMVSVDLEVRSPWGDGTRRRDIPRDNHVIHVVRHPLDVIASMNTRPDSVPSGASAQHLRAGLLKIGATDPGTTMSLRARMIIWHEWTRHCRRESEQTIRVSEMPTRVPELVRRIGIEPKLLGSLPSTTTNARPHARLAWADLDREDATICEQIRAAAGEYGFVP